MHKLGGTHDIKTRLKLEGYAGEKGLSNTGLGCLLMAHPWGSPQLSTSVSAQFTSRHLVVSLEIAANKQRVNKPTHKLRRAHNLLGGGHNNECYHYILLFVVMIVCVLTFCHVISMVENIYTFFFYFTYGRTVMVVTGRKWRERYGEGPANHPGRASNPGQPHGT